MRQWDIKTDNTAPSHTGRLSAQEDNARGVEVANVVASSGITLDPYDVTTDSDLYMLSQAAARYASGGIACQDTGAANTHVLSSVGAFRLPKSYFTGMMVVFYPAADNTGPATVTVNSIGAKPVLNSSGGALVPRDIRGGHLAFWVYNAADNGGAGAFRIAPWAEVYFITTAITITIGGSGPYDHATLVTAFDWLSYRRITETGSVTIQIPAGQMALGGAVLKLAHPNAERIVIQGAALTGGGFPADAQFQVTNNTAGARTADAAANLAMLRARIPTELQFTAGGGLLINGRFASISRLLVTGQAASNTPLITRATDAPLDEIAVHGSKYGLSVVGGHSGIGKFAAVACGEAGLQGYGGAVGIGSTVAAYQCKWGLHMSRATHLGADGGLYARGNEIGLGSFGAEITCTAELSILSTNEFDGASLEGGLLYAPGLHANGNGRNGVAMQGGARLITADRSNVTTTTEIKNNGVDGVVLTSPAAWVAAQTAPSTLVMSGQGGRNIYAVGGGASASLAATGVSLTTGGGTSIVAYAGAQIDTRTAGAVGTVSPALNTTGNFNAHIAN